MDGSHAALPIWMDLIAMAERGRGSSALPGPAPSTSESAQIDRESGLLAAPGAGNSMTLHFAPGTVPSERAGSAFSVGQDFARGSSSF